MTNCQVCDCDIRKPKYCYPGGYRCYRCNRNNWVSIMAKVGPMQPRKIIVKNRTPFIEGKMIEWKDLNMVHVKHWNMNTITKIEEGLIHLEI